METPPPPARPPRPPLTYRKLFRWGLVFWVLVWLTSICATHEISVWMKGGGAIGVEFGDGALTIHQWLGTGFQPKEVKFHQRGIWEGYQPRLIRNYPEFLIGKFSKIGRKYEDFGSAWSFPIAGFLWFWLAAGLCGEMKLLGPPGGVVWSRKRVVILGVAMLTLNAMMTLADHLQREEEVAESCSRLIVNINYFLSDQNLGGSLRWNQYWGNGGASRPEDLKCPSGAPFLFFPMQPEGGGARCSRSDHQRFHVGCYGK